MSFELKAKKEAYNKVVADLQAVAGKVQDEQRSFNADESAKVAQLQSQVAELRSEIETLEQLDRISKLDVADKELRNAPAHQYRQAVTPADYDAAFRGYILNKIGENVSDEQRSAAEKAGISLNKQGFELRNTTKTSTAPLQDLGEIGGIVDVLRSFGGIRQVSTVIQRENGSNLNIPVINDTANSAGIIAELGATANTAVPVTNVQIAPVSLTSGVFPVSIEAVRDAAFPLQQIIRDALATRLARAINTVGTVHATFQGITNQLSTTALAWTTASGPTYAQYVAMWRNLNSAYRPNARWMMNSFQLGNALLLLDANGLPLIRPDAPANGAPGQILGNPIVINDDLPNNTILYGDFSKNYLVDAGSTELVVLNELYRVSNNAIGMMLVSRHGSRVVDTNAILEYVGT